jgi:hypothetical protein
MRLVAWVRDLWATAQGYDAGEVGPLPRPLMPPRPSTSELIAEAERRGTADAQANIQDNWSFGGPDDPISDEFDPPYVHVIRRSCVATVDTLRGHRGLTRSRLAPVTKWLDESEELMKSARRMISNLAVREAWQEAETIRASQARLGIDDTALRDDANANASSDELPWEGESAVLGWFWRATILACLAGTAFVVAYPVLDAWLGGPGLAVPLALFLGLLLVVGPYLAAVILRGRQATGAEKRLAPAMVALSAPWLYLTGALGILRGQLLTSTNATLHLTPLTGTIMFIAILVMAAAMAFMLGLARRHPFQDAYVRHRTMRNRLDVLRRSIAEQLDPAFPEAEEPGNAAAEERAIVESFAAAEYAYFAALVRTVGDPLFTQAVQQRRGLRPQVPPPPPSEESGQEAA